MKKAIFSLLFLLFAGAAYSQPQVCAVTGTFYDFDGTTADSIEIKVVQVFDSSGSLIYSKPITYRTGGTFSATPGVVTFNILRNSVAYIAARAMGWDSYGSYGRPVTIPNAASGNLATFVSPTVIPESTPVVLPVQLFFDSTGNTIFPSDTLWLGAGLAAVPKGAGSNDYAIINTSTGTSTDTASLSYRIDVARDIANGKADADSMKLAFDRLGDRADADSVFLKADTASLHAQKFAVLTDQVAGKANGDSVSTALQSKVSISDSTSRYATPTQVYTTVKDSLDAYSTNGTRGLSSTKRIFAQMDSITFIGEAGDVIDLSLGNNFRGTISANDTLSFSNAVDGQVIQVVITNAGTHTLSWTGVSWPGGTQPVLTAVANKRSIYSFIASGGMIHGVAVLNY